MKKAVRKELKKIANQLPPTFYYVKAGLIAKGSDVIAEGKTHVSGQEIDPNKRYHVPVTYEKPVNHLLRLKRAFLNGGKEAILKYVDEVCALQIESTQEIKGIDYSLAIF